MSNQPTAAIIGATGTVGRGIVRALHDAGWAIVAVGRDASKLAALENGFSGGITTVVGSVADDAAAARAAGDVHRVAPSLHAVITTVNAPPVPHRLLDTSADALVELFRSNVVTHHCAARAFLPLLAAQGRYIGLGGGMADFTVAGMGGVSLCQAAQRNLFRFLAQESEGRGVSVVELMLFSNIVDLAVADPAEPRDIRADEVGAHVLAVLQRPEEFAGPILTLKSRKQIGLPERVQ